MSASEFAFLALGLLLGVATGAALMEVVRSRPPAPREVRVTVAPDAVPIRPSTLSHDPFSPVAPGPAPFGPGDRRETDRDLAVPVAVAAAGLASASRTPVPSPGREPARAAAGTSLATTPGSTAGAPVGIAVRPEPGGLDEALRAATARATVVLADETVVGASDDPRRPETSLSGATRAASIATMATAADRGVEVADTVATGVTHQTADLVERKPAAATGDGGPTTDASTGAADRSLTAASGPCGELRAIAEDRCAVATRARTGANAARDALRDAQRTYDDHLTRAEEAETLADPRAVQRAKEEAQQAFRVARDAAPDREALDHAAREWLDRVNKINLEARDGAARAAHEHAAANALVTVIERLTVEADAARIAAEAAEEACLAARQAVADCEEQAAMTPPPPPPPSEEAWAPGDRYPEEVPGLGHEEIEEAPTDREARILRILRGDRDALVRTVAELAGDDPRERRRWQLDLTAFTDALVAQAIETGSIDVDQDDRFWSLFTRSQSRDIVQALASLGYRFDGLGGFADGRVPSQRDLSLAVGYAGLDPMRIRIWPTEAEMPALFADARVAADEYLADAAGGLTLGELVALLGPRAEALTDLWNEWGRVRPRLLAID